LRLTYNGQSLALEGERQLRQAVQTLLTRLQANEDAASFERTLNTLTGKINRATAVNDRQRQLSRRARVMWTLYAGFAYILAALLLTLVTGWQNWGVIEGTVVAGGPVL
jgi:type VI protein secretion system component VasF